MPGPTATDAVSWQDQTRMLAFIYAAFHEAGNWPTFLYVDTSLWGKLEATPRDCFYALSANSYVWPSATALRSFALQDDTKVGISLRGFMFTEDADDDLLWLLRVVRVIGERAVGFRPPSPTEVTPPRVTSDELRAALPPIDDQTMRRQGILVRDLVKRPWGQFSSPNEHGQWSLTLDVERARPFREVHTIPELWTLTEPQGEIVAARPIAEVPHEDPPALPQRHPRAHQRHRATLAHAEATQIGPAHSSWFAAKENIEPQGERRKANELPRPLAAALGAAAFAGVIVTLLGAPDIVVGAVVAFVVSVAALHRQVWRWKPATPAAALVLALTVAGGAAGAFVKHQWLNLSGQVGQVSGIKETTGGATQTWTDYNNAGGHQGATVPAHKTVTVSCAVIGHTVQDGDRHWYRIATPPWRNRFYASADAFYNHPGKTTGSLHGTPAQDPRVPAC